MRFYKELERSYQGNLRREENTTGQFWLNLQTHYNLEVAKDRLGERLEAEVQVLQRQALTDI